MKPGVRKFLKLPGRRSGTSCSVCADARVAADVADWAQARASGSEHTLHSFYEGYLLKAYASPPCRTAVRNHVLKCLKVAVKTGLPLE